MYEIIRSTCDLLNDGKCRLGREFYRPDAAGIQTPVVFRSYKDLGFVAVMEDLPRIIAFRGHELRCAIARWRCQIRQRLKQLLGTDPYADRI